MFVAYVTARRNKRRTLDEQAFELNYITNIENLVQTILDRTYRPSHGIAFVVHDPVIREIFAAPFRDRLVHHFLFNMNAGWWEARLIYDSYSCRKGKGSGMAVSRLVKKMRQASRNYTRRTWIYKFDIQSFFMSLRRDYLYEKVLSGLEQQYPNKGMAFEICKFLWHRTIMDDPTDGVIKRGSPKNWKQLPFYKSLFHQRPGRGIVIGNLTSQLLSNIFLDMLDKYITVTLGYRYYGRYVDDFYILVPAEDKKKMDLDIKRIESFLSGLGLKLHPKKRYIQPIEHGVSFIGAKVFPRRVLPSRRVVKNFRRTLDQVVAGRRDIESVISYLGIMEHRDSNKILKDIFDNAGLDYNKPRNKCSN